MLVSLYFCLFVCLPAEHSKSSSLQGSFSLYLSGEGKQGLSTVQLAPGSSHLICPNGTAQGFTTSGTTITLVQLCYSLELSDHAIATSMMPLSSEILVAS